MKTLILCWLQLIHAAIPTLREEVKLHEKYEVLHQVHSP